MRTVALRALRQRAAPGSSRWLAAEAGGGGPSGGDGEEGKATAPAAPRPARSRFGSSLLERVLGPVVVEAPAVEAPPPPRVAKAQRATSAGPPRTVLSRSAAAEAAKAAAARPAASAREGPPRVFSSRKLASPELKAAAEAAEQRRSGRESLRPRGPEAPAPASFSGERPVRERSARRGDSSGLFSASPAGGPRGRASSPRRPGAGAPRDAAARSRASAELAAQLARAQPPSAPPDFDLPDVEHFLRITLDTELNTDDVGTRPELWHELATEEATPEQLLATSGQEPLLRRLSGVSDDAEWAAITQLAMSDAAALQASMRRRRLARGGSGLAHAQAEDEALAARLVGAGVGEGEGEGRAFADLALRTLLHNPRWSFAAKARALDFAAQRLQSQP